MNAGTILDAPSLHADSDEAGHAFQDEAGHLFRFHSGRRSDLKPATLMITWVVVDVWFEFRLGSSQSRFRGWDGPLFSHALACQFDAVGIVDKAIEDRVGDGRISDDLIPALDGHLAGDDYRAPLVSILDNLEEVTALFVIELFRPPVVQDRQIVFWRAP